MPQRADKHEIAFARYFAMGDERTLAKIAEEFNVSIQTVNQWSLKYGWKDRLKKKGEEVAKEITKNAMENLTVIKARQAQISRIAIGQMVKKLNEMINRGELPEFSFNDLEKMMKHELLIYGGLYEQPALVNPLNFININLSPQAQNFRQILHSLSPEAQIEITNAMSKLPKKQVIEEPKKEEKNASTTNTTEF